MAKPILLYNAIYPDIAEILTEKILENPEDESIELWINSPGGSLTAGWSILAALNESRSKINMTVTGDASSMAFYMLLFADNVKAYDTSNFLIHRAGSMWEEMMNEDELKDLDSRNKVIRKKLEAKIDAAKFEEVTKKKFDDIFSMEGRIDVRLTAQQAKKIGLVDEIAKLNPILRAEIENKYYNDIAALAIIDNQTKKSTNMTKLIDLIFGEKDPILLGKIGEVQFAYSKLEIDAKVKVVGENSTPISGSFEVGEKKVTIVNNEITAIETLDNRQKEIDVLKSELEAMKKNQITAEDVKAVIDILQEKQNAEISEIKALLEKAKISVSAPKLPVGDFKEEISTPVLNKDYQVRKEIEERANEKQALRDKLIKGGI